MGSPPKSSPAGGIFPGEIRPRGGFLHANVSPSDFLHDKSSPAGECIICPLCRIRRRLYDFARSHEEVPLYLACENVEAVHNWGQILDNEVS